MHRMPLRLDSDASLKPMLLLCSTILFRGDFCNLSHNLQGVAHHAQALYTHNGRRGWWYAPSETTKRQTTDSDADESDQPQHEKNKVGIILFSFFFGRGANFSFKIPDIFICSTEVCGLDFDRA